MNRRAAILTMGGSVLAARDAPGQQDTPPTPPRRVTPEVIAAGDIPGARPLLCLYSGCLSKIAYPALPEIVGQIGYDGIDLTVMNGGHVDPSKYMVQMDRAFQTFQDGGLDVPMVTTDFTSATQPYAYPVLYLSGMLGGRFCRLGVWPPPPASPDPTGQGAAIRGMAMRNDLGQFAALGTRCQIVPLLANHAGSFPGRSIPEAEGLLNGIDDKAFGYCFDPVQAVIEARAANGWEAALSVALPRLAAIALSDIALDRDPDGRSSGSANPRPCPLGEGVIDWKKFFSLVAAARFHGPVSLHKDYASRNDITDLTKDLAFARARVGEAWPR